MPTDPSATPSAGLGPALGTSAPAFAMRTTLGPRHLSDYAGSWLVLFSHPGDFTPVCTSEFLAFADAQPRFSAIGCELLALSVDSLYAHLAWVEAIAQRFGRRIGFPIGEDPSMAIARAYGMLDPAAEGAATVRASFVIDPGGTIRAAMWYPMNVGRSVAEILRAVQALQMADATSASTPEAWQPGSPLLHPAPQSVEELVDSPAMPWFHRTLSAPATGGAR